ncbi:MAG: TetR family transcriptional regulator [Pseudohongiella sp.]|uniref:TetR family transcriptional regulator n=1 Tax=Pseudohongiella sp. TaxID=1979412 RepID=UPI00349FD82C
MAKKTKEQAQETRQSILDAAIDVFTDKGVAGASLNEIAERAGVTRGAIYWHFKNKLDIFAALQDQLHQSVMDTVLADMEKDHPQPLQQLEQLCVALLMDLETNTRKSKILSIFYTKCDYSGEMATFLDLQNANKAKSIELFSHYFKRARKQGHLDADVDPHTLTLSLFFYLTGILHEHLRDPELFDLSQNAGPFIRQFFRGVSCRVM